jgi:hypothetical protein
MRLHILALYGLLGAAGLVLLLGCGGGSGGGSHTSKEPADEPSDSISLSLIGTHTPGSDDYDDDCIGCHGNRLNEVALDGKTPTAHATMKAAFGTGNARCLACHSGGTDFLSYSALGLRRQVDVVSCLICHGVGDDPVFYAK